MARSISLNGLQVLGLYLRAPLGGSAWFVNIEAAGVEALSGAARIFDGANEWKGWILSSGVLSGVVSTTIVGGAGGLSKKVGAKSYTGTIVRTVVQDILAAAGETLSQRAISAAALRTVLTHWTRMGGADGTAAAQLQTVLDAVGASWRVLPAGTIWVGTPSFQAATPEGLFETHRDPARGRVEVALDALDLVPDSKVKNDQVGDVEYRIEGGDLRATYWVEA